MKKISQLVAACSVALALTAALHAQAFRENTFNFIGSPFDHSAWKALSNYPSGYVVAGSKFFEPNNTSVFFTGFDELAQEVWTAEAPSGFTSLDTAWKSIAPIGTESNPSGFFYVLGGMKDGIKQYFTVQVNKTGGVVAQRFGPLTDNIQFGGACQAVDGGYFAVGGTGTGSVAMVKFNRDGELEWKKALAFTGFGWTVQPVGSGGYVIGSTGARITRIDADGDVLWSTAVVLPVSPDTSAYTYTEFEEIVPQERTGTGFIMTGSAFSNSSSGVYTARINSSGSVAWNKINDVNNTSQAGTPVCWANSPIEYFNQQTETWEIANTWRNGPVSAGGTLFFERMNPADGGQLNKASLMNTIPVQEAFTVRQHAVNRIVIAGVRGGYSAAYSFTTESLP